MRLALYLLVALGCALRLTGLAVHSLWFDECATLYVATSDAPLSVLHDDRHPPLSFYAFRAWIAVFGTGDTALRALPALVSCASLAGFALVVQRWAPPRVAVVATAVQAVSAFAIWYGQEVRMYTFVEAGSVAALAGLVAIERGRRWPGALLVFAGTAAATGSHYLGACVAAQVGLVVLARGRQRLPLLLPLAATAGGVGVWLPWMVTALPDQLQTPWGFQARMSVIDLVELPVRFVLVNLRDVPSIAVDATAALVGLGLAVAVPAARRDLGARSALAAFAAPIGTALALALVLPPNFAAKYLIASSPWCVLAVVHGLARLPRRAFLAASVLLVLAVLTATIALRRGNLREDYRSACAEVAAAFRPGDWITSVTGVPEAFSRAPLRHYLGQHLRDEPFADNIVSPRDAAATLADPSFDARVHVVWREAAYAEPALDALRAAGEVVHRGALRRRIQHLVLAPRLPR
jgi:mannosyltransferase